MKIQSLSIAVPSTGCINNCKFCVSRMHNSCYKNLIEKRDEDYATHVHEYVSRLNYARDNGCNSLMLTGNCEPQQNKAFLTQLGFMLRMMDKPFRQIEMQTTGVLLDEDYLRFLRDWVGVNVISISLSSFYWVVNDDIIGAPKHCMVIIPELCQKIKDLGFVLRLSLNMVSGFCENNTPEEMLKIAKAYGADQVTFRKMYSDNSDTPQSKWVKEHALDTTPFDEHFISLTKAHPESILRKLEYGQTVFAIDGMSVVYDTDCMAKEEHSDELKYLILRPDCKLYSSWDDKASLVF